MNIPALSRTEISALIDEWILNERNRAILKRRLCDTEDELKRAERMLLALKSVDFSIDYIQEQQSKLHKKYKKKAEKV